MAAVETTLSETKSDKKALQEELAARMDELQQSGEVERNLRLELSKVESQLKQKIKTNERLEGDLDQEKAALLAKTASELALKTNLDKERVKTGNLEDKIVATEKKLEQISTDFGASTARVSELMSANAELQATLTKVECLLSTEQEGHAHSRSELEQTRDLLEKREKESADGAAEAGRTIAQLETTVHQLKSNLQATQMDLDKEKERVASMEKEVGQLASELEKSLEEGKASAEESCRRIDELQTKLSAQKATAQQAQEAVQASEAQIKRIRSEFEAERKKLGQNFAEQLDKHDNARKLIEEELASWKKKVDDKDTEIAALHADFQECTEYVDELAKQKIASLEDDKARAVQALQDDLQAKQQQIEALETQAEATQAAQTEALQREQSVREQLKEAETQIQTLVREHREELEREREREKNASAAMHQQESELLQNIAEVMTEQEMLKGQLASTEAARMEEGQRARAELESLQSRLTATVDELAAERAAAKSKQEQHDQAVAELEARQQDAAAAALSEAAKLRAGAEEERVAAAAAAESAAAEQAVLQAEVARLTSEVTAAGTAVHEAAEAVRAREEAEEELASLREQLEQERRRHLMREGELEDKMCETKIRMYQYRDESLQSLLGLDTMAELEDIMCAIKAQQRESKNLRQLQMEMRRQVCFLCWFSWLVLVCLLAKGFAQACMEQECPYPAAFFPPQRG